MQKSTILFTVERSHQCLGEYLSSHRRHPSRNRHQHTKLRRYRHVALPPCSRLQHPLSRSVRPTLDSLNGNRFLWSKGGPLLRVQGPGISICAGRGQDAVEAEGGNISQAIVTGLVAYFLSLPDIGNLLRNYENTPKALIRYMQTMSYAKSDGTESVWNGLSHDSTQERYDHWFGEPAPSKKMVDFKDSPVFLNN